MNAAAAPAQQPTGALVQAANVALAQAYARHTGSCAEAPPPAATVLDDDEVHAAAAQEGLTLIQAPCTASGFKGIYQRGEMWRTQVREGGALVTLGSYGSRLEAALAYARHLGVEGSMMASSSLSPPKRLKRSAASREDKLWASGLDARGHVTRVVAYAKFMREDSQCGVFRKRNVQLLPSLLQPFAEPGICDAAAFCRSVASQVLQKPASWRSFTHRWSACAVLLRASTPFSRHPQTQKLATCVRALPNCELLQRPSKGAI